MTSTLVPPWVAAVRLGRNRQRISEMVDSGELRWVWNFSTTGRGSLLRLWREEIENPGRVAGLTVNEVLTGILGQIRQRWTCPVLCTAFCLAPASLHALAVHGGLASTLNGHSRTVDRAALVEFLKNRMLNSAA